MKISVQAMRFEMTRFPRFQSAMSALLKRERIIKACVRHNIFCLFAFTPVTEGLVGFIFRQIIKRNIQIPFICQAQQIACLIEQLFSI